MLSIAVLLYKSITSIKLNTDRVTCPSYLNLPDFTPSVMYKSQTSVRNILNLSVTFASSFLSSNIYPSKNLNTKHQKNQVPELNWKMNSMHDTCHEDPYAIS